jgi:AcrR family transcriptional regulator
VKDPRSIQMQVDLLVSLLLHGHGPHPQTAGSPDSVWERATQRAHRHVPPRAEPKTPAVNIDSPLRLLSSAVEVFARHGYHGAGLREIAEHAGVAFQLVRYHFGSKPDLWLAVLMHLLEQQYESVYVSRLRPGPDLGVQLRTWVRRALYFAVEEPRLRRILTREYFSNSAHFMRVVRPRLDDFYRLLLDTYSEMRQLGVIRHLSVEQAGILVQALINPMTLQPFDVELTTGWPVSDPRSIELHMNLLVRLLSGGRFRRSRLKPTRRSIQR